MNVEVKLAVLDSIEKLLREHRGRMATLRVKRIVEASVLKWHPINVKLAIDVLKPRMIFKFNGCSWMLVEIGRNSRYSTLRFIKLRG